MYLGPAGTYLQTSGDGVLCPLPPLRGIKWTRLDPPFGYRKLGL